MTETQTLEILDVLKTLPAEKIDEVRERYGKNEIIDESDEWTEEDFQDAANASLNYAEEVKE